LSASSGFTSVDRCYGRHGKAEFLDFLKQFARTYPRRELHVGRTTER